MPTEQTTDTFSGTGLQSIIQVLRPNGPGWQEMSCDVKRYSLGFPARAYIHSSGLFVISAVETMSDEDKGPEYHISISRHHAAGPLRCSTSAAKWVLRQFGLDGAEEDNHVPYGKVRNFWRPVANPLVGLECECKAEEPAIVEDKGDFTWRPIS